MEDMKTRLGAIKEHTLYIICLVVSSVLIIAGACFHSFHIASSILIGVGCSGGAASVMSIFLALRDKGIEQLRVRGERQLVFRKVYDELKMLLQRVLWFNDRWLDASFNWELSDDTYSTLSYMLASFSRYGGGENLSFDDAKDRLAKAAERFSLESYRAAQKPEQDKMEKLFRILAYSSMELIKAVSQIVDNKLMINRMGYMTLDEINTLQFNVVTAIGLMNKPEKNYGACITMLLSSYEIIRSKCMSTDGMTVVLQGSVSMSEL